MRKMVRGAGRLDDHRGVGQGGDHDRARPTWAANVGQSAAQHSARCSPHLTDHVTCHVIDLPGAGSSRFTADTTLSIDQHIRTVRRVVEILELDDVAVVGHEAAD